MEDYNELEREVEYYLNKFRESIDRTVESGIPMDRDYDSGEEGHQYQKDIENGSFALRFLGGSFSQGSFDAVLYELNRSMILFEGSITGRNLRDRLVSIIESGLIQGDLGVPAVYRDYIPEVILNSARFLE